MGKPKRPVYDNIFEYMSEHYVFQSPNTPITQFYKKDIYENQYKYLTGPVNPEKTKFQGLQKAAELITEFAKSISADLVGFTKVYEHFVFDGTNLEHDYAIVLAVEMDYELINTAPEAPSGIEVLRGYWRLGGIACKVAEFVRELGYSATAHHPRSFVGAPPTILHTAAAIDAGLGEQGKHGLLITPEFGPRVRVATVTTELPIPQNEKKYFGVDLFCQTCQLCAEVCEGEAIPSKKENSNGFLKFTIDPYKCLPYFAKYDGCNLCVSKCAFNKQPEELKSFIKNLKKE